MDAADDEKQSVIGGLPPGDAGLAALGQAASAEELLWRALAPQAGDDAEGLAALALARRALQALGVGEATPPLLEDPARVEATRAMLQALREAVFLRDLDRRALMSRASDLIDAWVDALGVAPTDADDAGADDADADDAPPNLASGVALDGIAARSAAQFKLALLLLRLLERDGAREALVGCVGWLRRAGALDAAAAREAAGWLQLERAAGLAEAAPGLAARLLDLAASLGVPALAVAAQRARLDVEPMAALDRLRVALDGARAARDAARAPELAPLVDEATASWIALHDEVAGPEATFEALLAQADALSLGGLRELHARAHAAGRLAALRQPLQARGLLAAGDARAALAAAGAALERAWVASRAAALLAAGEAEAARRLLARALHGEARGDAQLATLMGQAHEALGQWARALAAYQLAATRGALDASLVAGCGRALAATGQTREACEQLERAFHLGHDDGDDALTLAERHLGAGRLAEAERWLEVADELDGDDHRLRRARALLAIGALEAACARLDADDPQEAQGYLTLAAQAGGASRDLDLARALAEVAWAAQAQGRRAAEDRLWETLDVDDGHTPRLVGLLVLDDATMRSDHRPAPPSLAWIEAVEALSEALTGARPDDAWSHALHAAASLRRGEHEAAAQALRVGVQLARLTLGVAVDAAEADAAGARVDLARLLAIQSALELDAGAHDEAAATLQATVELTGVDEALGPLIARLGAGIGREPLTRWLAALDAAAPGTLAPLHAQLMAAHALAATPPARRWLERLLQRVEPHPQPDDPLQAASAALKARMRQGSIPTRHAPRRLWRALRATRDAPPEADAPGALLTTSRGLPEASDAPLAWQRRRLAKASDALD